MILLVAVVVSFCGVNAEAKDGIARVLSLCHLVDNWKQYHRQTVRVQAVFAVGKELGFLYDPACKDGAGLTDVEFRKNTRGVVKTLDQLLVSDKRARVILEGVFYGPEPYSNIDPKLPPPIKERLEKAQRGYGHMELFQTMIEVTRVMKASKIGRDVPRHSP